MNTFYGSPPAGWSKQRLKYLMAGCQNGAWGAEPGGDALDAVCVRVADFDWHTLSTTTQNPTVRSFPLAQARKLALRPGDLLLEKSGGGEKTPVGRVVAFDSNIVAVTSNFVARIRPVKSVSSRFLLYVIAAQYMSGFSHRFIKQNTGIQNLDDRAWFSCPVWLPDIKHQHMITKFLDAETQRLDALIVKKELQIKLLDMRASRVVTDLVMGQSGRPESELRSEQAATPIKSTHWITRRAALLFQQMSERNDQDLPVLSISIHHGISDRQLEEGERDRKVTLIEDRSTYKRVRPGYLAYNMMRAWQGAVGVSTVDGAVSPAYVVAKPRGEMHSAYYQYLLRTPAFIEEMRRGSKGIADFRMRLYWEQFRQLVLPVPPLEEQRKIAAQADEVLTKTAKLTKLIQTSIERLRERRQALITATVSGQIDVQQFSARKNAA